MDTIERVKGRLLIDSETHLFRKMSSVNYGSELGVVFIVTTHLTGG